MINTLGIIKVIFYFVIGILLFGPFASDLCQDYLGLPMVIPEFVYIPLLFWGYKKMGIKLLRKPNFALIFMLWVIFLTFAFIWNLYSLKAIFSTARSFLLVGIFYSIGKSIKVDKNLLYIIFVISIGSILGWVFSSYLNFQKMLFVDEESVVYGNMLAIAYAFALLLLYERNYVLLAIVFAMNVFLSFTTALRRQILVSLMSIAASLGLLVVKYKKVQYLGWVVILSIPIFIMMPQIEEFIKDANPYLHHRVFERSEQVLEHDMKSSDQGRISHQLYIFTEIPSLIIPHGYVSQNTEQDKTGLYNDIPTLMLAYTFGVLVLYFYMIYLAVSIFKTFRRFQKYDNEYYGVLFVVGAIFFFLHFVEAAMFIYTYTCPFTGLTLGLLFRKDYISANQIK